MQIYSFSHIWIFQKQRRDHAKWFRFRERWSSTGSRGMSKRLGLRFLLSQAARRRKYFWAWLATWVGVLVVTNFFAIPLQSPFPSFSNPARKVRCSSSDHGTPKQKQTEIHSYDEKSPISIYFSYWNLIYIFLNHPN